MTGTPKCPPGKLCYGDCNPNVVCHVAGNLPQCSGCVVGWTGQLCDQDVDECAGKQEKITTLMAKECCDP